MDRARGHILTVGGDAFSHVVRGEAAILPEDGNDRNIDRGEDVRRHAENGQPTEPQDQQGHHHEGIGTPEGQLHNPHTLLLRARKRCNEHRALHICRPATACMTSTPQVGYDRCHCTCGTRRRTTRLPMRTCTASPCWFSVVVRTLIRPWSGRDCDGRISSTSLSIRSSSPGRTGRGQRHSSKPAPTMPPAGVKSLSTRSRMVTAAVCQPLAASPWKSVSRAALSS